MASNFGPPSLLDFTQFLTERRGSKLGDHSHVMPFMFTPPAEGERRTGGVCPLVY
jgi:hypothetical protein